MKAIVKNNSFSYISCPYLGYVLRRKYTDENMSCMLVNYIFLAAFGSVWCVCLPNAL